MENKRVIFSGLDIIAVFVAAVSLFSPAHLFKAITIKCNPCKRTGLRGV